MNLYQESTQDDAWSRVWDDEDEEQDPDCAVAEEEPDEPWTMVQMERIPSNARWVVGCGTSGRALIEAEVATLEGPWAEVQGPLKTTLRLKARADGGVVFVQGPAVREQAELPWARLARQLMDAKQPAQVRVYCGQPSALNECAGGLYRVGDARHPPADVASLPWLPPDRVLTGCAAALTAAAVFRNLDVAAVVCLEDVALSSPQSEAVSNLRSVLCGFWTDGPISSRPLPGNRSSHPHPKPEHSPLEHLYL